MKEEQRRELLGQLLHELDEPFYISGNYTSDWTAPWLKLDAGYSIEILGYLEFVTGKNQLMQVNLWLDSQRGWSGIVARVRVLGNPEAINVAVTWLKSFANIMDEDVLAARHYALVERSYEDVVRSYEDVVRLMRKPRMEFRRKDRSIPLSLWGTENMLEYFRDMRDMSYEEFLRKHYFWPSSIQVVVRREDKAAWFDPLYPFEVQNQRELDGIVKLVESLDEDHRLWGNAEKVFANEFERELLVVIDTSEPVADVHTYVRVDEPEGAHDDTDIRLLFVTTS